MNPGEFGIGVLIGSIALWLWGGVLARWGGWLFMATGAFGVAVSHDASAIFVFVVGVAMWLAGHWHYAVRHQGYKSPLARYVFCRWAPAWADPTRNWAVPVEPQRAGCEPGHEGGEPT
jgi:hypothetical protein